MAIVSLLLLNGCGMLGVAKKPEVGPAGAPVETKPNPPLTQRFISPPGELSDLEATAGVIFEGIIKNNWLQAETGLNTLSELWPRTKALIGDKKGVKDADEALEKLKLGIHERKSTDSHESLAKFMGSMSDIGKSYKLSPISDVIGVGNAIRTVYFYVESNDWLKAKAKMKELDGVWGQAKPNMETFGILKKVTITHSIIKQMKDAVEAENKGSIKEHIATINENMGYIRDYYRGK
ncbi:MAG: hypothetical protein H7X79_14135 [Sporomusaceae bacterium]|nr:hypothetical protein [Sporomusaceae bacterium]